MELQTPQGEAATGLLSDVSASVGMSLSDSVLREQGLMGMSPGGQERGCESEKGPETGLRDLKIPLGASLRQGPGDRQCQKTRAPAWPGMEGTPDPKPQG